MHTLVQDCTANNGSDVLLTSANNFTDQPPISDMILVAATSIKVTPKSVPDEALLLLYEMTELHKSVSHVSQNVTFAMP